MAEAEWLTSDCPGEMFEECRQAFRTRHKRMIGVAVFQLLPAGTLGQQTREWLSLAESIVEQPTVDLRSSILYDRLSDYSPGNQVTYAMRQHFLWDALGSLVWCAMMLRQGYHHPSEGSRDPELADLLREIVGNPFRSVAFAPEWRTSTAIAIARGMYESRDFTAMPILADALQDAGCDNDDVLQHCRGDGTHVRGCWVVDLLLGKE